jgi:hypothetical protein
LTYSVEGSHVSRITDHQFAVLAAAGEFATARALTADVETALREFSRPVAGWSEFPSDGTDALTLFTAAGERMYARSVARGRPAVVTSLRAS